MGRPPIPITNHPAGRCVRCRRLSGCENIERRREAASRCSRRGAAPYCAAFRSKRRAVRAAIRSQQNVGRPGRRSVRSEATARRMCGVPLIDGALPAASDRLRSAQGIRRSGRLEAVAVGERYFTSAQPLLFSRAARSAKALWLDFGPCGLAVEPSLKYCWSV